MDNTKVDPRILEVLEHFNIGFEFVGEVHHSKIIFSFYISGDKLNVGKVKLDLFEGARKIEVALKYRITLDAVDDIIYNRAVNGLYPNVFYSMAGASRILGKYPSFMSQKISLYEKAIGVKTEKLRSGKIHIDVFNYFERTKSKAPKKYISYSEMLSLVGVSSTASLSSSEKSYGLRVKTKYKNGVKYYLKTGVNEVKQAQDNSLSPRSINGWVDLDQAIRNLFYSELKPTRYGIFQIDKKHKGILELFIKKMRAIEKPGIKDVRKFKALHLA